MSETDPEQAEDPEGLEAREDLTDPEAVSARGFLFRVGDKVRRERARQRLSRKALAHFSGVSERFLANLEAGRGNISILRLRQVARALGTPLELLIADRRPLPNAIQLFEHNLQQASLVELRQVEEALGAIFRHGGGGQARDRRIALIGLRGAGKSTLGPLLAEALGVFFIELNREIEIDAGLSTAELFALYGAEGYRAREAESLRGVIQRKREAVLATGGGLVAEAETFNLLLARCLTVWIKASPEEHMARVLAQGDRRPMAGHPEALRDLEQILEARTPLYARADLTVDTSGRSVEESLEELVAAVERYRTPRRVWEGAEG